MEAGFQKRGSLSGQAFLMPRLRGPRTSFPLHSIGQSSSEPTQIQEEEHKCHLLRGEVTCVQGGAKLFEAEYSIQAMPVNLSKLFNLPKSQFPLL